MRFSLIDASNRWQHKMLVESDVCMHLFEYRAQQGGTTRTNTLIRNLKKKPSEAKKPGFGYKDKAIAECAAAFRAALDPAWIENTSFIPIPCSKAASHPDHDDRIERICRAIDPRLDVRALVTQAYSTKAAHESGKGERVAVQTLVRMYQIDDARTEPPPKAIAIVDDVLTSGTHYRAVHDKLRQRWPDVPIIGLFVARRVLALGRPRT